MAQSKRSERILARIWQAIRNMIEPELAHYRSRFPRSRRREILERMASAAAREDGVSVADAGMEYLQLTQIVPPGCYAICMGRDPSHYLSGVRVLRRRSEDWSIHLYSPQVWR